MTLTWSFLCVCLQSCCVAYFGHRLHTCCYYAEILAAACHHKQSQAVTQNTFTSSDCCCNKPPLAGEVTLSKHDTHNCGYPCCAVTMQDVLAIQALLVETLAVNVVGPLGRSGTCRWSLPLIWPPWLCMTLSFMPMTAPACNTQKVCPADLL